MITTCTGGACHTEPVQECTASALLLPTVASLADLSKRLLVGRAKDTRQLGETLLPKRLALPVFASDAMSSVAYATQEILIILALAGTAWLSLTPWAALAVVVVLVTVVAAYRQNVHAYPSGGGDYEVANTNLGPEFGLIVASALLVDYVLTVAVSTSAGVENLASTPAFSWMGQHRVSATLGIVLLIVVLNLRGVRESGFTFAIPTYAFMFAILCMIGVGAWRLWGGDDLQAPSADYEILPELKNLGMLGVIFLGLRAFASGCTALTGVEAISNGVPAFKKPKAKNAATTLAVMGALAVTMFVGVTFLAIRLGVKVAENPNDLIGLPAGQHQDTVIAQIAMTVFGSNTSVAFYFVQLFTALILVLAANTAFNGFPVLASILAQDRYMPRQMHTRGDRLVFSNGILLLAGFAALLIWVFQAQSTRLIQLYIVGVFVSFTLSQLGMVRHWNRLLGGQLTEAERSRTHRRRAISGFAFVTTATVLAIALVTKFVSGAWIAIVAMAVLWFLMHGIHKHYERVRLELTVDENEVTTLPSRVHAVVLVSKIHKPTLRAVNYARASRPSSIEAITVDVDEVETAALVSEWDLRGIPVPLKVLSSPYREITRPIVYYIKDIRRGTPRDVVTVYIPEYVVGHWWEHLLHNQSALRIKGRLLFTPGVMVVSVPWQLTSSVGAEQHEGVAPGAFRRGEPIPQPTVRQPDPDAP